MAACRPLGTLVAYQQDHKNFPHLRRYPQDIFMVPFFVLFTFLIAIMKVYAIFTLNTQGWMTRWDISRLPKFELIKKVPSYLASSAVIASMFILIFHYKQQISADYILAPLADESSQVFISNDSITSKGMSILPPFKTIDENKRMLVTRYVVKEGDALDKIADNFGVNLLAILAANITILPNWNILETGYILNIPRSDLNLKLQQKYTYTQKNPESLKISYDNSTNTIRVSGRGKKITLKTIQQAIGSQLLEETKPKNWLLRANLLVGNGVMLELTREEVERLKLESNKNFFVMLKVQNGIVVFDRVTVTSWDSQNNNFDENYQDGRSYILVKDSSRMDIYGSEFAYLGYQRTSKEEESVYGVSWRMSNGKREDNLLTGEVIGSSFHHNYFGAYTFGATAILWKSNRFYKNIQYGLDPHDDSNGFLVEDNVFFDNGNHGLIFSKRCLGNTIRKNLSYNNKLHGIMLHEASNYNIIADNTIYGNLNGIAIYNSNNNLIQNNTVYSNLMGIRLYQSSKNNLVVQNSITSNKNHGVYIYGDTSGNQIGNNLIKNNLNGFYTRSPNNEITNNVIEGNKTGFYFTGDAQNNLLIENQIINNKTYGIFAKNLNGRVNYLKNNSLQDNAIDMYAI